MNKIALVLLTFVFLASCSNADKYEKMKGDWVCVSWIDETNGKDMCNDNVHFSFDLDKTYKSQFDAAKEEGTYYLVGNVLYVTPKGKTEFGVEMKRLDSDTMTILMNRSGVAETLTLVKR